ncbi:PGRS family protein [Sorangium sp. So ce185]|uniref:PGRS family protein n=1 Tax=Sorangium sp. So ce185 TaxID=3133287 RepID=UPI003F645A54
MPRENVDGVDDTCGVFVSARGGASNEAGTKAEPLSSLQGAVDLAKRKGAPRVYACAGDGEDFIETVVVPGGVTIYGGLDCNDGWKWVGDTEKTILTAQKGVIPLTMRGLPGAVHIEDLHVVAQSTAQQDQNGAGLSSIAALAHSTSVELVRCVLEARHAGAGADGADHLGTAAQGAPGEAGGDACSAGREVDVRGGRTVTNECGTPGDAADDSWGGKGGNGSVNFGDRGYDGQPILASMDGAENGGFGHNGLHDCAPGRPGNVLDDGAPGTAASGSPGADATGIGEISLNGYAGVSGGDGGRGAPGQGGGGGGGERGVITATETRYCPGGRPGDEQRRAGAAGGSGGAGGCAGAGGRGGLPGGSSIALISLDAALSFEDVTLKAGNAGNGGQGGPGQPGGEGGNGGKGGRFPDRSAGFRAACDGGKGGTGGTGGKGGGGQGGHSLGIAFRGAPPSSDGITAIELGEPGTGGRGSAANGSGAPGMASNTLEFN